MTPPDRPAHNDFVPPELIARTRKVDELTKQVLLRSRAAYLEFAEQHPDRLPSAELLLRPAREIVGLGAHHTHRMTIALLDRPRPVAEGVPGERPVYEELLEPFMWVHLELGRAPLEVAIAYSDATDRLYAWWWRPFRGPSISQMLKRPPVA